VLSATNGAVFGVVVARPTKGISSPETLQSLERFRAPLAAALENAARASSAPRFKRMLRALIGRTNK